MVLRLLHGPRLEFFSRHPCVKGASDRHLARQLPGARDRVPEGAVGGRGRPAPLGPAECKIVELTMKNEISRAASGGRVHRCRPRSN